MPVNHEDYMHYFEESNLSDEEKREYIEELYFIVESFVQVGFGVDPVSQVVQDFVESEEKKDGNESS